MNPHTLITGFPRIGEFRELKKAIENYWSGRISIHQLEAISDGLRKKHWLIQHYAGIDLISCNDFSWYDRMLDTAVMLNAIPERFRSIKNPNGRYFAMARGTDRIPALEMTKWFNTNYHYIVPELDDDMPFSPNPDKILTEYHQARQLGIHPKINLIGPLTFLELSKPEKGRAITLYFDQILMVYKDLLNQLTDLDDPLYIQMEEPILTKDPSHFLLDRLGTTYQELASISDRIRIIVTTYFDHSCESTPILAQTPIWGIGLDLIYGKKNYESMPSIKRKKLIAGIVDGRNIWINHPDESLDLLERLSESIDRDDIIISTSCSLLHVPFSKKIEPESPIKPWISFACEKLEEVALLSRCFHSWVISNEDRENIEQNVKLIKEKQESPLVNNQRVSESLSRVIKFKRDGDFNERIALQKTKLNLPLLPTTTIGSFPQTPDLRRLRKDYKAKIISLHDYEEGIKNYIDECIRIQEEIGLDILVHGEPERNDMVEYFGEMLKGFHFTQNGWVQSYGSRCVKPPIIYGDVWRPEPMTVKWITYTQHQTMKPVKGMLTGPITMLNWAFVRNDKARSEVARQIAMALRDEIRDLQNAGIQIIQVDEAAFKEGYPLRKSSIPEYENWAVESFQLAVSDANRETQIHTHMCYSEFNSIIHTIEMMDADVITIETARSGNRLLSVFRETGYRNQIGPGVYDIHSPRIPSMKEFLEQILSRISVLPIEQVWINPDCGLKTRQWEEVKPALLNMVQAAKKIRSL
ncbi:MAG: 5-methyltetrahydropteroyltriglutamate--homocysteine S-methyltransferase [Candidatus Delongbacteria bacterium]|nr:5-methyltetrahydropteroyltriglutamate--homocysteine S-methyltransferase [Candidatus Delongbacteria bacterium]